MTLRRRIETLEGNGQYVPIGEILDSIDGPNTPHNIDPQLPDFLEGLDDETSTPPR